MFSFFQSGQDPALPPAGKCPSLSHSHPSRGCDCRPRCRQETQAASPCYRPNRCQALHRTNPLLPPRRLLPLSAATPAPARTQLWILNQVGRRSRRKAAEGLTGSRRWLRIRGSSSSEKSEVSEETKRKKIVLVCITFWLWKYKHLSQGNWSSGFSQMSVWDWVSGRVAKAWPSLSSLACDHVNTQVNTSTKPS